MRNAGHIQVEDTKLYYERHGSGQPMVLLHGNGEDGACFAQMLPLLKARYQVIVLDTRGHGQSQRGKKPMNFTTFSEDLLQVLDGLELDRVHLLGFSDGGNTGLVFAAAYPQRLRSLITVGANLSPKGCKANWQFPIVIGWALCALFARFSQQAVRNGEVLELMVKHPNIPPEHLGHITCPALILAGEKDMIRESETRKIAEGIPGADLQIIPGADHFLPTKQPRELVKRVLEFLDGLRMQEEADGETQA